MSRYIVLFLLSTSILSTQNIDGTLIDLVRYSKSNYTINARSAGLGASYNGILNDNAAIISNPAGITLTNLSEISVGLNNKFNYNTYSFLDRTSNTEINRMKLNNFSIASPIFKEVNHPKNLFFGISYNSYGVSDREIDITTFNPNLTYTGYESTFGRSWTKNLGLNTDQFEDLITDSLTQNYKLVETGRRHNLLFALASEVEESFSIGGSLNIFYGSFEYNRVINEEDTRHIYESDDPSINQEFDKVRHTLNYSQDYISASFNLGLIYNLDSTYRFSLNFVTPESMVIDELFTERATLTTDDGRQYSYDNLGSANSNTFKVSLPWTLAVGSSYKLSDLIITGSAKMKGFNSIEFTDTDDEYYLDLNNDLTNQLKTSFELGGGFEYDIPYTILTIRGGYTLVTSPIEGSNDYSELISGGLSIFPIESLRLDLFYQAYKSDENIFIYGNANLDNQIQSDNFGIGITYRY